MRMYSDPLSAVREVERDMGEMAITVPVESMQDKAVAGNPDYVTREVRAYGFKIIGWKWNPEDEAVFINYVLTGDKNAGPHKSLSPILGYIEKEFRDRTCGYASNPGSSFKERADVWNEFLHGGRFAYTYSERIAPQLQRVITELTNRPGTRQGIITIHTNICPMSTVAEAHERNSTGGLTVNSSDDLRSMGGAGRVPCSLYYQVMRRDDKLDLIYAMRSCDFLTHFPVDIALALRMQNYIATALGIPMGQFTYFTGSLHAYAKDLKSRNIF